MISEYEKNSIKLHSEDDFLVKKKYIDKNNAIIKKVISLNKVNEFFDKLMNSDNQWVLADAAMDGFNCFYDIHKCMSILENLKANAKNIEFSSDFIQNKKAQDYFSTFKDIDVYRKEVAFYDALNNDYLYKACHKYFGLLTKHIFWYYHQSNKNCKDESLEIEKLLNELGEKGYLSTLFEIANKKYQNDECAINYLAVNSYYACKYNYDRKRFRDILAKILEKNVKDLTPNLICLINAYLNSIDNNSIPDLKSV